MLTQSGAVNDTEKPPVKLEGDVAKAVQECLLVAHPSVEEDARKEPDARGEWGSLWVRCQSALQESPEPSLGHAPGSGVGLEA